MKKYDHFLGVGEKVLSVLSSPTYSGISLLYETSDELFNFTDGRH
jgi:hypothetical protein